LSFFIFILLLKWQSSTEVYLKVHLNHRKYGIVRCW